MTPERAREIGRRGGRATLERHGRAHLAQLARRGGRALVDRYTEEHMREIGHVGWIALVQTRFGGDEDAARAHMRALAQLSVLSPNFKPRTPEEVSAC